MPKLVLAFFVWLSCLPSPLSFMAKPKPHCKRIHEGRFVFRPNSQDELQIMRTGSFQQEIRRSTGDTALWQITWTNKCSYKLKLVKFNRKLPKIEQKFYEDHQPFVNVSKVTDKYYTFVGRLDSASTYGVVIDTIWFENMKGRRMQ
jgi:hypothetical protein